MLTPYAALTFAVRHEAASPRLTWYDRSGGPADGERVELSGRVLLTWANKAANLLQNDLDVAPGSTVALELPTHWRACYWALAVWSLGATLATGTRGGQGADVLVTDSPEDAARTAAAPVLLALPALVRQHPLAPLPARVVDEAATINGFRDDLHAWSAPAATDLAWTGTARATTYADLAGELADRPWGDKPRVLLHGDLDTCLSRATLAWSAGGSVVLVGGGRPRLADLEAVERTTAAP